MKRIFLAITFLLVNLLFGCQTKELVPTGYEDFCWGETQKQIMEHEVDFLTFIKEEKDEKENETSLHFVNEDILDPIYFYATEEPYTTEFVFDKSGLCEINLQLDQDVSPQAFLDAEEKLKEDFPNVLDYEHRADEDINFSTHTILSNGNTNVFLIIMYGYENNNYGSIHISYYPAFDSENDL